MDFTKFVAMLERRGLFFVRARYLDDAFEGSYSRANEALRPQIYSQAGLSPEQQERMFGQLKILSDQARRWVLVNCWHMNERESAAMWKLYTVAKESVCLQSTYQRLRSVLPKEFVVSVVHYIDYAKDWSPEGNLFYPFVNKRLSFEHERELRALVFQSPPLVGDGINFAAEPPDRGMWQTVDLPALLEAIYIGPAAPGWFRELVEKIVERYGLGVPVRQSALDDAPFF